MISFALPREKSREDFRGFCEVSSSIKKVSISIMLVDDYFLKIMLVFQCLSVVG